MTDSLTGLRNRRAFEVKQDRQQEDGRPFALLVADLDNLKKVNDQQGHIVGDHLLQRVGQRLAGLCGPEDLAFRLGGDELVVLISAGFLESLATRMASWRAEFGALRKGLALSIGIACFSEDHGDVWGLFREADQGRHADKAVPRAGAGQPEDVHS